MDSIKPRITSIRYFVSKARPKPKTGDRSETKKHGVRIRVPIKHGGAYVTNSRGGQTYKWCTPEQLTGTIWEHLLNEQERAAQKEQSNAK